MGPITITVMKRATLGVLNLVQWWAALTAVLGAYGVAYAVCMGGFDAGAAGLAVCCGLAVWLTAILKAEVDR